MSTKSLRVVSLLPSATELICVILEAHKAAGGSAEDVVLVGRCHECDFPPGLEHLPMLTASRIAHTTSADIDHQVREQLQAGQGLYTVDKPLLASLRPDVIVTQSLCKVCSVDYCLVESIVADLDPAPKLVDTNPMSLTDVFADLTRVGEALGLQQAAAAAVSQLQQRVDKATSLAVELKGGSAPPAVGFMEWMDPIFCAGHWSPQLIVMAGGQHPLNPPRGEGGAPPSFVVAPEAFQAADPDVILVAPCGMDIAANRKELPALTGTPWWSAMRAVQQGQVWIVDGNQMFNRPGPRLVDALEWLVAVLHDRPDLGPPEFPAERLEASSSC